MEGLLAKYNRSRKISKGVTEFNRTGKTKEERDVVKAPIEDNKDGFIYLYVASKDTQFIPESPVLGSVVEFFNKDSAYITYKLMDSNPAGLLFLDIQEGKKYLGEGYGLEVLKTQLASAGVSDQDIESVVLGVSDENVPGSFSLTETVSIVSAAGFDGFVYSSPLDKKSFIMWSGVSDLRVVSYSTDLGLTWVAVD